MTLQFEFDWFSLIWPITHWNGPG